jgi:hypothetical protein
MFLKEEVVCVNSFKNLGKYRVWKWSYKTTSSDQCTSILVHWVERDGKEETVKCILLVCARKFQNIHYPVCYVHFV